MPDWNGITIHAGWIPQLLDGDPKRKWSMSGRSPKGIKVKGYNRSFVQQIEQLGQEREQQLVRNQQMDTYASYAALSGNVASAMVLLSGAMREKRGLNWRDIASSAREYENRAVGMSIRGQSIWYMLGETNPKDMAQRLLDKNQSNNPFNFGEAERWYQRQGQRMGGVKGQVNWALQALNLHSSNIDRTINTNDIQSLGDAAGEVVFTQASGKETVFTDRQVPANPEGTARSRDFADGVLGEMEETEELKDEGHHGLPDNYMTRAFGSPNPNAPLEQEWHDFMNNTVLNTWNTFAQSVLARQDQPSQPQRVATAVESVKGNPAANSEVHALNALQSMSLQELRKMKHEFAIADLNTLGSQFGTRWREGIPISDRDPVTGDRTYASSDLSLDNNLEFTLHGVQFLTGLSHSLAFAASRGSTANVSQYYSSQQKHSGHQRMNNSQVARSINGITYQGLTAATASGTQKINASFSVEDCEDWFQEIMKNIAKDIKKKSKDRSRAIHDQLEARAGTHNEIFWALPYISIEEGIYKG